MPRAATARAAAPTRIEAKLRVWVVFGGRVKFGDGRAGLLERVAALGSFKKAVEEVGMSYRGAWGYFRELERAAGMRLLERHPGGGPRGGTRLTPEGRRFLDQYRRFRRGLDREAARRFQRSFRA
jgi:molybdate transport system regulatory protein